MKNLIITPTALMVGLFATAIVANAQVTLLSDNFESGSLAQWSGRAGGPTSGLIVPDPFNSSNQVVTFTAVNFGGDLFGAVPGPVDPAIQKVVISFDFLALPVGGVVPSEFGGFAGLGATVLDPSPLWVAATYASGLSVPPPVGTVLVADGQWHHYNVDLTSVVAAQNLSSFAVTFEDWGGLGSVAGDVYFDNIKVTAKLDPNLVAQLVPCAGPATGGTWRNHGAYVSAMSNATYQLLAAGLITLEEQQAYVSAAAKSSCGK